MRSLFLIILAAALSTGCSSDQINTSNNRQKAIDEIRAAEKGFEKMAADKGIAEAFFFYADSNAVIKRQRDTLIQGKEAIRNYYSAPYFTQASVTWAPDFTDASEQGDFGYTYGKYNWQVKDDSGHVTGQKGVFHTVWKRQTDGSWKYVWD